MDFEKFIEQVNAVANPENENGETIYIEILGLTYHIIGAESYDGEDANGEPYMLCKLFLAYNDEHNSTECEILVSEEFLRETLEKHEKEEKERNEVFERAKQNLEFMKQFEGIEPAPQEEQEHLLFDES
jgi:hypothetical protein